MRRTEITVETNRVITVKGDKRYSHRWCEVCGSQVQIAPVDAVALEAIRQLVNRGLVHLMKTDDGPILICLSSLGDRS